MQVCTTPCRDKRYNLAHNHSGFAYGRDILVTWGNIQHMIRGQWTLLYRPMSTAK